jgi:hypothetical protein
MKYYHKILIAAFGMIVAMSVASYASSGHSGTENHPYGYCVNHSDGGHGGNVTSDELHALASTLYVDFMQPDSYGLDGKTLRMGLYHLRTRVTNKNLGPGYIAPPKLC